MSIEWPVQQKDIRYLNMAAAHTFPERFRGQRQGTDRHSLDLTALRVRDLAEPGRDIALRVYQAPPSEHGRGSKILLRFDGDVA